MDPITTDMIFPALASGRNPDPIPADNYDPILKTFEQMVDHAVLSQQQALKAEEQAAVAKAKMLAEQQRKIAFLMGAVQQAETALAGVSDSPGRPLNSNQTLAPGSDAERAFKESQLLYWKSKLTEAGVPDGTMGLF